MANKASDEKPNPVEKSKIEDKPKFPPAKIEEKKIPAPAKAEPVKEGDDFKNSLAALIGRGKPGTMKKPKLEEPPKPVE